MESKKKQQVISWINKVLSKLNYTKIKVTLPDADITGGYAADVIYVDVVAEQNGSEKTLELIIKKGKDNKVLQNEFNFQALYNNEINVYSKFVPYLQEFAREKHSAIFDNMPNCYGTVNEDQEFVIIMDNLKRRGFRVHEINTPLDLNHAKLVLEAYGKWHAFWFAVKDQRPKIFEEFGKCNSLHGIEKVLEYQIGTMVKTLDYWIGVYEEKNKPHIIEKLKILKRDPMQFVKDSYFSRDEAYEVIRHGDCWNNNFLFHYNDETKVADKVVIVDWQVGVLGSPALDLSFFLFYCCTREELQHLDNLLQLYYDSLSKKLIELGSDPDKCFPREALQASFKRYTPCALLGMPMVAKVPYQDDSLKNFDMAQVAKDGNFNRLFNVALKDPEGYFNRIDGIFELCIQRGLI